MVDVRQISSRDLLGAHRAIARAYVEIEILDEGGASLVSCSPQYAHERTEIGGRIHRDGICVAVDRADKGRLLRADRAGGSLVDGEIIGHVVLDVEPIVPRDILRDGVIVRLRRDDRIAEARIVDLAGEPFAGICPHRRGEGKAGIALGNGHSRPVFKGCDVVVEGDSLLLGDGLYAVHVEPRELSGEEGDLSTLLAFCAVDTHAHVTPAVLDEDIRFASVLAVHQDSLPRRRGEIGALIDLKGCAELGIVALHLLRARKFLRQTERP